MTFLATYKSQGYVPRGLIAGNAALLISESISLLAGKHARGTLLGRVTLGDATSAAKAGGNTGNGVLTLDAAPRLDGAQAGVYSVTCTAAAANGGTFTVVAPDGYSLGTVAVGATFTNQIKFSIADGSTDFIVGDRFNITVAAGLGGFVQSLSTANDGSQVPEAILAEDTDATTEPVPTIAYTRGDFIADDVIFGAAHTVDSTRAVLRDKGIFLIGQVPV